MSSELPKITVIVPTGNRRDVIEDCLKSVRWADEVIVIDSFSTDGTLEIANRYADMILQNEYGFSAKQKNWAIPQAANEWILLVDTDERVTENLKEEIIQKLQAKPICVGYRIARENYVLGALVKGAGYFPDYQIRLFKRDHAHYELRRVHAHVILDGQCGTLESPLVHYAHRNLDQTIRNLLVQMTTWEAEERIAASPKSTKFLWFQMFFRPLGAFFLRYFWQGGWKSGYHGLAVSILWAIYVGVTYLKIWEKELNLTSAWWEKHWAELHIEEYDE